MWAFLKTNDGQMTLTHSPDKLADVLAMHLPYLRRYARALTGNQERGDKIASVVIEVIVADPTRFDCSLDPSVALFQVMHEVWKDLDPSLMEPPAAQGREAAVHHHLARLTPDTREALLLSTIEGFTELQISKIMKLERLDIRALIEIAHVEMASSVAGKVMIIEDEAIIAMELEGLVKEMGHEVTGVARTYQAAIDLATQITPDLILADIQLADQSSGIDAVNELLQRLSDVLVIFITAFPERLLTGNRPEPAFLISKPYEEDHVRSAVSQAMFYSTTENLTI